MSLLDRLTLFNWMKFKTNNFTIDSILKLIILWFNKYKINKLIMYLYINVVRKRSNYEGNRSF